MEYFYDYDMLMDEEVLQLLQKYLPAILTGLLVFAMVALALSILFYVFNALGFYTVAKRRGIREPWLAWIPIANLWVMGCISDQYQYVVKGKVTNRRKILLGLSIGSFAVSMVMSVITNTAALLGGSGDGFSGAVIISLLSTLLSWGISITATVFQYIALYDYYSSCCPRHNVLFLVLGIFFGFLTPFFVFFNRKKDEGMPPRKPAPEDAANTAYDAQPRQEAPEARAQQPEQTELPLLSEPAAQPEIASEPEIPAAPEMNFEYGKQEKTDEFADFGTPAAPDITQSWDAFDEDAFEN